MSKLVSQIQKSIFLAALLVGSCTDHNSGPVFPARLSNSEDCQSGTLPLPAGLGGDRRKNILALVDDMVAKNVAPGAVLLIEHKGKIVLSHVAGFSDLEDRRRMDPDALFRLYSMTKPITSLAAIRLVSDGRIRLEDKVSTYIPYFAAAKTVNGTVQRPITIRDLLTHQSGIVYRTDLDSPVAQIYRQYGIPAGPGVDAPPTDGSEPVNNLADLSAKIARSPLANSPGDAFTYGNSTDILGHLIEIVTRKSLSKALEELVIGPLQMKDTAFFVSREDAPRLTSAYSATSSFPRETKGVLSGVKIDRLSRATLTKIEDNQTSIFLAPPNIEFGGAGLVGSAADYLRFTAAMRQQSTGAGHAIVPPSWGAEMSRDHLTPTSRRNAEMLGGLGFGYGFAVKTHPTADTPKFPHCGYFWGGAASTFFWIDPQTETSGVLMTQVFGGDVKSYWLAIIESIYSQD